MAYATLTIVFTAAAALAADVPKPRDFSGIWQAPYTPDLSRALGKPLPLTPFGAEQFAKVELADDPTSFCLPFGPTRGIQAPLPMQFVQTADTLVILFEYQRTFRLIYLDGRPPPKDFEPEWFGHSIGKWAGNTLVVDTIGIDERTWVDTAGHEHSDQFHLIERFEKTGADEIRWTATYADPVYFSEPFTLVLPIKRQNTVMMSYSCEENNRDRIHLDASKKPKEEK